MMNFESSEPEVLLVRLLEEGIDDAAVSEGEITFDDLLYGWARYASAAGILDASDHRVFVKTAFLCLVENVCSDGRELFFKVGALKVLVAQELPALLSEESYREVVKAAALRQAAR